MTSRVAYLKSAYDNSPSALYFLKKILRFVRSSAFSGIEECLSKNKNVRLRDLEEGLKECELEGSKFGGWALTKSAIRALSEGLNDQQRFHGARIFEFGGGQSTLLWSRVAARYNLQVTTLENDENWYKTLNKKVGQNIDLQLCKLKEFTKKQKFEILHNCDRLEPLSEDAILIDKAGITTKEAAGKILFYNYKNWPESESIDAVIIDGPHGEGRTLSLPALKKSLRIGTLILVDDYDHYPFLNEIEMIVDFRILRKSLPMAKSWIIVEVISLK